jgi:hypothetical protein
MEDGGLIRDANSPNHLAFQWHPDTPDYATPVEINIEPADGGTIIRLREYGYADTESAFKAMLNCAVGWWQALTLLKYYLELDSPNYR